MRQDSAEGHWLSYGRTSAEQFESPVAQINDATVSRLGLAWYLDLPGQRTLEATPLEIDGTLYFSGTYGKTYAVDASSGRLKWQFDPDSARYRPDIFRYAGSLGGHRGVAYWRGRVYVGVIDGRLFSLDAQTGKVIWSVQTAQMPLAGVAISGAPRVFGGTVFIGNACEFGTARGDLTAYDAESGRQRWRFYTVPGDPAKGFENGALAMASKTWSGSWWKRGGNGSVWGSIVYDAPLNRVYFGTANWNTPTAVVDPSQGDHLFTSSILAVRADTGQYLWHYQENPRGDRDYDSNAPLMLADLTIGGRARKVLLHAPKNGFFYVIDRMSGHLISAQPFAKVTWATHIDLKSGRPVEIRGAREVWPGALGAHSWQPMSFSPQTKLVYIPTMQVGQSLSRVGPLDGTATLLAWDPVAQRKRWEVRYEDSFWNGGTLSTAGNLVFQGTGRGQFVAYRATTGERLWSFSAGLGIVGTPISYAVAGTQYISVLVGYGGASGVLGSLADYGWRFNEQPRRLLTFALDRTGVLPPGHPPRYGVRAVDDPHLRIDTRQARAGRELYHSMQWRCMLCHGPQLVNSGSFAPDLRESVLAVNWDAFRSVVRGGVLASAGMPKFDDLSEEQARAIYFYIRERARELSTSRRSLPQTH